MRIKTFLISTFVLLAIGFIACDDDLNTVGESISPNLDGTVMELDTIYPTAKTVSLNDSIYARSIGGLLGEYNDKIFGKVTADYMCEFYLPANLHTQLNDTVFKNAYSVDSVEVLFLTFSVNGDTTKVVGLTTYELNNPLKSNYFTNVDIKDYCDLSTPLGKTSFVYKDTPRPVSSNPPYIETSSVKGYMRTVTTKIDTIVGRKFIDKWKDKNSTVFKDPKEFRKFFPGIYQTMTYGSQSLLSVESTHLIINYKYVGLNKAKTADSLRTTKFTMHASTDVIQMNRVKNNLPQEIKDQFALDKADKTYMKTPAGVCTEITIPLGKIIEKINNNNYQVNSASFSVKGFTEEEINSELTKPSDLLFIDKDSVENFFQNNKLENNKSVLRMARLASNNSYHFSGTGYNLAQMVGHYVDKYKDKKADPDLKITFLLMPVNWRTDSNTGATIKVSNLIYPTSAVLRTDKKNLAMSLVYSKYKNKDSGAQK